MLRSRDVFALVAKGWRWSAVVALLLGLGPTAVHGADDREELTATKLDYQIKAGFIFSFAKFVEWPTNAAGGPDKFFIAVLGDAKIYTIVTNELSGKRVGGKVIETLRCKPGDDLKRCAMIFITRDQAGRMAQVRKAVAGAPVLTVGEFDRFAERGGCINFVRRGDNIRFEVNLAAVERAGLKISSKLASMAIVVRSEEVKK